ncbi:MAG: adenylyltransferase/cytidyltransferase family protein [Proteobacteria bacterium]|nr:adenylyltransferase/cytidyltransferase family protein [Pseudomonadota bacterium]
MLFSGQHKILSFTDIPNVVTLLKNQKQTVIFAHGVFDMLHRGHVTLLVEAKKIGGILIVGVENDKNVKVLKGKNRPIHSEQARLYVLSNLTPVDHLFLIPEYKNEDLNGFYNDLYKKIRADVLATCVDAGIYGPLKKQHAAAAGMKLVDITERYELNTSKVIELLRESSYQHSS